MPKLEHMISYEWRPPPSREDIRKVTSKDCTRRFKTAQKQAGDLFRKEGILRHPIEFNQWETHRICNAVPERSIGNPKGRPGLFRYHAQSDDLPPPTDEMLHPQHGSWLKEHYVQRDKHLYPVFHAKLRVGKAEEKAARTQTQRELTRDLTTRPQLMSPHLSDGVKCKLAKAKLAVTTTRHLNKLVGHDAVAEAEELAKQALLRRIRSEPALELKPATPRHRAKHLRSWKGPDRRFAWTQTDHCLKHTTPGLQQEEEHELHMEPRYRARGA